MSGEDKRSIARILSRLTEVFERAGIETPRLDAEVLLCFCLGKERADLYRDLSLELDDEQINRVLVLTGRRKRREPMAYIRGWREFWSLDFTVTPAVLVPRPETECLVEEVLRLRDSYPRIKAADPGHRGGVWGRLHRRGLGMARCGYRGDGVFGHSPRGGPRKCQAAPRADPNITFLQGDLYEGVEGVFDIVCSNPPYISEAEYATLAREVTLYEPRQALVAGPEGTEFHRRIAEGARERLKPGGWLLMEMGAEQRAALAVILEETKIFDDIRFRADYAGLDRVVIARRKL